MDTIFALASGAPPCGVAVVRVSGPLALMVGEALTGRQPRVGLSTLCSIRDRNNELIDEGLVLAFRAPASFTGEDVVEFQVHGSLAVIRELEAALLAHDTVRPAVAGEFAQRAFVNGKMDLTEAEGLADLIDAETRAQRLLALRQTAGETTKQLQRWADEVLELRALLEASIDFADEDDIANDVEAAVSSRVSALNADIVRHLEGVAASDAIRRGVLVVLAGVPNAGKSSLFNALVGRERVLVSDIAGTTRDYVEERLDLDGHLVRLVDTAGLRETTDHLEELGVSRSRRLLQEADIVVELSEESVFEIMPQREDQRVLTVYSKADGDLPRIGHSSDYAISMWDERSITELRDGLVTAIASWSENGAALLPLNGRQAGHLENALNILANTDFEQGPVEMRADALARVNEAVGRIVGQHDVEDILGAVFSRFCIGK